MEAVWIALIVAIPSLVGPIIIARITNKQRRADKVEDWAREDTVAARAQEVAEKAAKVASELRKQQDEVARKVAEVATQAELASGVTNGKLAQIHELVNSNLTVQMEEAHAALVQQVVLMQEVVELNRAAGREPSQGALEAISLIQVKVAELQAKLADRATATVIADAAVSKLSTNV